MNRQGRRILLVLALALLLIGLSLLPGIFVERAAEDVVPPHEGRVRTHGGSPLPASTRVEAWAENLLGEVGIEEDGSFRFDALPEPPREYRVAVAGERFRIRAESRPVEILVPDPAAGDRAGREEPVPETIRVGGLLVAADGETPVAGAEVRWGEKSARSGPRGRFDLGSISTPGAGDAPLEVRAEGYRTVYVLPPAGAPWDDLYLRLVRR